MPKNDLGVQVYTLERTFCMREQEILYPFKNENVVIDYATN
jgi:hypothetical protein